MQGEESLPSRTNTGAPLAVLRVTVATASRETVVGHSCPPAAPHVPEDGKAVTKEATGQEAEAAVTRSLMASAYVRCQHWMGCSAEQDACG